MSEPDLSTLADQPYAQIGDRKLLWDIYRTKGRPPGAPAVLLVHGGGFTSGSRAQVKDAAIGFARRGFVALAIEYRLVAEAAWPAQLNDVQAAIRAAGMQADSLGFDPGKLFLVGFSAGAQLGLIACGAGPGFLGDDASPDADAPAGVAGIAAYFPSARLGERQRLALQISPERASELATASPINMAAGLPPTIFLHGTGDRAARFQDALDLHEAVLANGGEAEIALFSRLPHGFVKLDGMLELTTGLIASFFDRTVLNRETFEPAREAWAQFMDQVNPPLPDN